MKTSVILMSIIFGVTAMAETYPWEKDGKTIPVKPQPAPAPPTVKKPAAEKTAKDLFRLGLKYHKGEEVAQDSKKAMQYFKQAAIKGHRVAQYNTGYGYYKGIGVIQDYEQAFIWFDTAAMLGQKEAMNMMGKCYEYARGAEKNLLAAVGWYQLAVDKGEPYAKKNLARAWPLVVKDLGGTFSEDELRKMAREMTLYEE